MSVLQVPFVAKETLNPDRMGNQPIAHGPWAEGLNTSCRAEFSISHFNQGLCLTYLVTEPFLSVKKRKLNGDVHKDNCVEFFVSFDDDKRYYNFEFNCLGSIKAAFGESRRQREFLPAGLLNPVKDTMEITLDNTGEGKQIRWVLIAILPVAVFQHHAIPTFSGITCRANFTKCGDDLPDPHFLSWVNLSSPTPNFHQPSSFGQLIFEPYDNTF